MTLRDHALAGTTPCADCDGVATVLACRVEVGHHIGERSLCDACARVRGYEVTYPLRSPHGPAIFVPLPGPPGHSGEPWIFPPPAVGPGPPPAPSFVATFDGRGRVTSTQVARYPERVDVEELVRQGAAEAWLFGPPKPSPVSAPPT